MRDNVSKEENQVRHKLVKTMLEHANVKYTNIDGVYEGQTEASFAVEWSLGNQDLVFDICRITKQDCFLTVSYLGESSLVYLREDKRIKLDGFFQEVDRDKALELNNFSRNAETNKYYAVI